MFTCGQAVRGTSSGDRFVDYFRVTVGGYFGNIRFVVATGATVRLTSFFSAGSGFVDSPRFAVVVTESVYGFGLRTVATVYRTSKGLNARMSAIGSGGDFSVVPSVTVGGYSLLSDEYRVAF